jgi:filamentous hemagglutinin
MIECDNVQSCIDKVAQKYKSIDDIQDQALADCRTIACVSNHLQLIEEAKKFLLENDYVVELAEYSLDAASRINARQEGLLFSQALAEVEANGDLRAVKYCELNPGPNCKLFGSILSDLSDGLTQVAYAKLAAAIQSGRLVQEDIAALQEQVVNARIVSTEAKVVSSMADDDALALTRGDVSAGSIAHKLQRWEEYQKRGGTWGYSQWSNVYDANMTRATAANQEVAAYQKQIGWGRTEVSVKANVEGVEYTRRLDIADETTSRGVEFKTGYQSATEANLWEVKRDKALLDDGWDIQWVFKGTASEPLKEALRKAGISYVGG